MPPVRIRPTSSHDGFGSRRVDVAPVPPCPSIQLLQSSHPARRGQPVSRAAPVLCGTVGWARRGVFAGAFVRED